MDVHVHVAAMCHFILRHFVFYSEIVFLLLFFFPLQVIECHISLGRIVYDFDRPGGREGGREGSSIGFFFPSNLSCFSL